MDVLWFHVTVKALLCQDARELVALRSHSQISSQMAPNLWDPSLLAGYRAMWVMTKGTILDMDGNSSTYVEPGSCYIAACLAQAHFCQPIRLKCLLHHFPPFWFGSICSHPARDWRHHWTPKAEEAHRLATCVQCWMCVFQMSTAKTQEI